MKRMQKKLLLSYLIFLLGLRLAGSVPSPSADALLFLSYLLPFLLFFLLTRGEVENKEITLLRTEGKKLLFTLLLFFPTVLLLFLLSALTSLLLGAFGLSASTELTGNILTLLLDTVLFPAVLEELLFRYLPLSALAPHGKRTAVLFSALCFSLAHCDLFQIPYAFAAGILFAVIDLAAGSVLPSLLFHVGNNALSVLWILYGASPLFSLVFFLSLSFLSLFSLLLVFCKRGSYRQAISEIFPQKEKYIFTKCIILYAALAGFYTLWRLIGT